MGSAMSEKKKILYIDDEFINLQNMQALFRDYYKVLVACSAIDGQKIIDENADLKLIISDQRMPDESGVDFFKKVVKKKDQ